MKVSESILREDAGSPVVPPQFALVEQIARSAPETLRLRAG